MSANKECNILKYNVVQFSGESFNTWAFRIKSILRENNCIEAIENEEFYKKEIATQKNLEARAQALIIAAVADSHLEYVRKDSAYQMFRNLEQNFKEKSTRSKLFLRRQLNEIKYIETEPLKHHFTKIQEICTSLKEAGGGISEEEQRYYEFSQDEMKALEECDKESFYRRCLPFSTLFASLTAAAIKLGFLRRNPHFGAVPKLLVAIFLGYVAGRVQYAEECEAHLRELPEQSPLGKLMRRYYAEKHPPPKK